MHALQSGVSVTNVEDRINTPSGETNNPTETNRAKRREVTILKLKAFV